MTARGRPHQKKRFGQVFLKDRNAVNRVLDFAGFSGQEAVLEIGGGDGCVTLPLSTMVRRLAVIELDDGFHALLSGLFSGQEHVRIFHGDILAAQPFEQAAEWLQQCPFSVYGSIPYNITTQIVRSAIDRRAFISRAVFVVQKEVARRLSAAHGNKEYGFTSVLLQLSATVCPGPVISRRCFSPVPAVDSQAVEIDLSEAPYEALPAAFVEMLSALFGNRRKQISTTLKKHFGRALSEQQVAAIENLGLSPRQRPEELSPEELFNLFNALH